VSCLGPHTYSTSQSVARLRDISPSRSSASTASNINSFHNTHMAFSILISNTDDFNDARASVETLLSVTDYFRLDASDALDVLAEVTRATANWRRVAESHGLAQRDLADMRPAFEHAEAEQARALTKGRS
jgi:hypothetical protein